MRDTEQGDGGVRVFLSYASEDTGAARVIADALKAAGIEAWFDQGELRGGDAWDQKIRRQIRECHLFIPLISAQTQARAEGYFRLEWHLAEQRSFLFASDEPFIVPVVIDATPEASARVPDRFRDRQWTRLAGGAGAAEFADRLIALGGGGGRPSRPASGAVASLPSASARSERSVAVLAFANLSADKENEYFSDGISDEVLTLLQGIPGLRVAARTSAFSFKGKSATAEEIGQRLGVAHLVEGSVQKSGTRIKIMARMSSTGGEVRWSRSFTREMNDVFALQEELAMAIVGELKGQLSGANTPVASQVHDAARGGTRHAEAYGHYLMGRHWFGITSEDSIQRALGEFSKAVALDSRFALGWAWVGRCHAWLCGYTTMSAERFEATLRLAREASKTALDIEPELVLGLAQMAWLSFAFDYRVDEARRWIDQALAQDSTDPDVLMIAAGIVHETQGSREAVELNRRAVGLDPVNARVRTQLALGLMRVGDYDGSRAEARQVMALSPSSIFAQVLLPFIDVVAGLPEAAERGLAGAAENWPAEWLRILCEAELGRRDAAQQRLERFCERYGETAAIQACAAFAALGEVDSVFVWLEKARRQHDPGLLTMRTLRFFGPVRSDPRWIAFWSKLGLDA